MIKDITIDRKTGKELQNNIIDKVNITDDEYYGKLTDILMQDKKLQEITKLGDAENLNVKRTLMESQMK